MSIMVREALGDKVVLGLEGGYSLDPEGLSRAVEETLLAFGSTTPEDRWKTKVLCQTPNQTS